MNIKKEKYPKEIIEYFDIFEDKLLFLSSFSSSSLLYLETIHCICHLLSFLTFYELFTIQNESESENEKFSSISIFIKKQFFSTIGFLFCFIIFYS